MRSYGLCRTTIYRWLRAAAAGGGAALAVRKHPGTTTYPALRARAQRRGAKIFFLDEAGIRSDPVLGRTWAPRGRTPTVATTGRRQAINAISAVNARGEFWYEVFAGRFNAAAFIVF